MMKKKVKHKLYLKRNSLLKCKVEKETKKELEKDCSELTGKEGI